MGYIGLRLVPSVDDVPNMCPLTIIYNEAFLIFFELRKVTLEKIDLLL